MKLKYRTQTQKPNQIQKTDQKQPQKQLNFKHKVRIHKRSGEREWKGDVKNMLLDISKIKKLGLKPKLHSAWSQSSPCPSQTKHKSAYDKKKNSFF